MSGSSRSEDAPESCATGKIRLFVSGDLGEGREIILGAEQSHYLAHVMRAKPGDPVHLFNGRDGEWLARVTGIAKRAAALTPERLTRVQDTVPDLTLAFAPVKRARLDFLVQKATELGVSAIRPVFTRHTMVTRVKDERLCANVVEAAEQCGRLTIPDVREPLRLDAFLAQLPADGRLLFCDECATDKKGDTSALARLTAEKSPDGPRPWTVLIGPEGGFAPAERELLGAHPGAVRVSLGPRIMRADTAAIAALTLWQAVLGDWA